MFLQHMDYDLTMDFVSSTFETEGSHEVSLKSDQ